MVGDFIMFSVSPSFCIIFIGFLPRVLILFPCVIALGEDVVEHTAGCDQLASGAMPCFANDLNTKPAQRLEAPFENFETVLSVYACAAIYIDESSKWMKTELRSSVSWHGGGCGDVCRVCIVGPGFLQANLNETYSNASPAAGHAANTLIVLDSLSVFDLFLYKVFDWRHVGDGERNEEKSVIQIIF